MSKLPHAQVCKILGKYHIFYVNIAATRKYVFEYFKCALSESLAARLRLRRRIAASWFNISMSTTAWSRANGVGPVLSLHGPRGPHIKCSVTRMSLVPHLSLPLSGVKLEIRATQKLQYRTSFIFISTTYFTTLHYYISTYISFSSNLSKANNKSVESHTCLNNVWNIWYLSKWLKLHTTNTYKPLY